MAQKNQSQSIFQKDVLVLELTVTGFPKQKPNGQLIIRKCVEDEEMIRAFVGKGNRKLLDIQYVSISTCRKDPKRFVLVDDYKKTHTHRRV